MSASMKHVAPANGGHKQVLVVAFHYPPDNTSSGVLRTLKFTQYLLQGGWRSTVLSAPVRLYRDTDAALAKMIPPEISVHRTWAVDLKQTLNIAGFYPGFLTYPDRYWPWMFSATRRGKQLLRDSRYDVLYTTYPVPTAHLIGLRLKRWSGLPWIADFRDPWLEDSMPAFERRLAIVLERKIAVNADRVICNTPAMRRMFLERYPDIDPGKFVTITNGYDEPDFADLVPRRRKKFHIIYPGVIDAATRNPAPLLAGIALALARGWLRRDDLEISFLGCGPHGGRPAFHALLQSHGLADLVDINMPRVPYREALEQLAAGDLLVALCEPLGSGPEIDAIKRWTSLQVPVKVYEYLRLGRPMLALVSDGGAIPELLAQTGGGRVVSPGDINGIALAIKQSYQDRIAAGSVRADPTPEIARYSRENLSRRLMMELEDLAPTRA